LEASSAVTVIEMGVPAVAVAGAVTEKCVAGPAGAPLTLIGPEVPVIEAVTVSVAVIVRLPTVFSVAEKVPTPLTRVLLGGSTAAPSLEVKWTVPA
jgi:hypothetical protein